MCLTIIECYKNPTKSRFVGSENDSSYTLKKFSSLTVQDITWMSANAMNLNQWVYSIIERSWQIFRGWVTFLVSHIGQNFHLYKCSIFDAWLHNGPDWLPYQNDIQLQTERFIFTGGKHHCRHFLIVMYDMTQAILNYKTGNPLISLLDVIWWTAYMDKVTLFKWGSCDRVLQRNHWSLSGNSDILLLNGLFESFDLGW